MGSKEAVGKAASSVRRVMRSGLLLLLVLVLVGSITGFLYLHFMGALTSPDAMDAYMTTAFEQQLEQRLGDGGVAAIESGMLSCEEAAGAFSDLSFSCTDIQENGLESVTQPIAEHYYSTSEIGDAHQLAMDYKPVPAIVGIIVLILLVVLSGTAVAAGKLVGMSTALAGTLALLFRPVQSFLLSKLSVSSMSNPAYSFEMIVQSPYYQAQLSTITNIGAVLLAVGAILIIGAFAVSRRNDSTE